MNISTGFQSSCACRNVHSFPTRSRREIIVSESKPLQPGLSAGKSIAVLVIVIGCILVLWPTIFYPMFKANFSNKKSHEQSKLLLINVLIS